jgi:hypothetical protein
MAATLLNERKPELLSRMAYGKSASQLNRAIQAVLDSAQAFEACAGERQSVTELRLALERAQRRAERLPGGRISSSTLVAASVWLDQLKATALRAEILEDCRVEADECEFDAARAVHQSLQTANRLCDLHQERLAELANYYSNEESDMVKSADTKPDDREGLLPDGAGADAQQAAGGALPVGSREAGSRPRFTVNVPPGGSKVSRQMIATLDSLGLPHRGGLLDVRGSDSGALADRLMEALDRRFTIRRDPVEGMRAVTRRYSAPEGSEGGDGALADRMAVCAGTVAAGAKQMQVLLEDLEELLLGAEDWSVDEPERVDQRREEVLEELDRVRDLAERPGGPPASHGDFHLKSLLRKLIRHHRALGFTAAEIPDLDEKKVWRRYPRPETDKLKERLQALPEAKGEQAAALVDQSFWWFWQIERQFAKLTDEKTDSEAAYHLRRVMTSAVPVIESVRIGIEENPGSAAWAGIELDPEKDRYLSEELKDTLAWLEELAQTYGLSDSAYEAMTRARMRELEGALGSIENSIEDCIERIEKLNNPSDDSLLDQIRGLCLLAKSSRNLASRLFPTTTA